LFQNSNPGPARVCLSQHSIESTVGSFTSDLKRDFSEQIAADPRAFKKQVVRLIRLELPPKRGRPNDPRLDTALRMLNQGKTVKDILRAQVPGFDQLDTYSRYLAEKGLRAAIARRRVRR
jgi:hypothetical protein